MVILVWEPLIKGCLYRGSKFLVSGVTLTCLCGSYITLLVLILEIKYISLFTDLCVCQVGDKLINRL